MIEFRALGTLDLRAEDGREITSVLVHPKRTALLAYLAASSSGTFYRRDALLALFWPELDAEHARAALRKAAHYLRRSLGDGVLISRGDEELGLDPSLLNADVAAFARALEAGQHARALELYRGPFLESFFIPEAPGFERWLEQERATLHERAFQAAWTLAEEQEAAGDAFSASYWGRRAAALAPANEPALRRLLSLLERLGDVAGAVSAFVEFARRFADEYEVEPSEETLTLVESIRARPHGGEGVAPGRTMAPLASGSGPEPTAAPSPLAPVGLAAASIAVLPFANLSPDPDSEYLSDGMTEELIFALSRMEGLRVAARTSAFALRGTNSDIREIGRRLGVAHIVEGSVRKVGNRLRVTVQLVDAIDGYYRWSQNFEREMEDVFSIQAEIAQAILTSLLPKLDPHAGTVLIQQYATDSVEAYDFYLRGGHAFRSGAGEESARQAASFFEQAIEQDPGYAPAYAGLSDALMTLASHAPPRETMLAAKTAALKSIQLDKRLAEGYVALASIDWQFDWNWTAAGQHYRQSLSVNPLLHTRCVCYAWYLAAIGELETAVMEAERARIMDPLARLPSIILGWMYFLAGRYEDSRRQLAEVFAAEPTDVSGRRISGWIHWRDGESTAGIAELEMVREEFEKQGGFETVAPSIAIADLAVMYARSNQTGEAARMLNGLEQRARGRYIPPEQIGAVYGALGELDEAFRWLDQAHANRSNLAHFILLPLADPLRVDARYQRLLQRIGLS